MKVTVVSENDQFHSVVRGQLAQALRSGMCQRGAQFNAGVNHKTKIRASNSRRGENECEKAMR